MTPCMGLFNNREKIFIPMGSRLSDKLTVRIPTYSGHHENQITVLVESFDDYPHLNMSSKNKWKIHSINNIELSETIKKKTWFNPSPEEQFEKLLEKNIWTDVVIEFISMTPQDEDEGESGVTLQELDGEVTLTTLLINVTKGFFKAVNYSVLEKESTELHKNSVDGNHWTVIKNERQLIINPKGEDGSEIGAYFIAQITDRDESYMYKIDIPPSRKQIKLWFDGKSNKDMDDIELLKN